jgi:hypothetical protein
MTRPKDCWQNADTVVTLRDMFNVQVIALIQ